MLRLMRRIQRHSTGVVKKATLITRRYRGAFQTWGSDMPQAFTQILTFLDLELFLLS